MNGEEDFQIFNKTDLIVHAVNFADIGEITLDTGEKALGIKDAFPEGGALIVGFNSNGILYISLKEMQNCLNQSR